MVKGQPTRTKAGLASGDDWIQGEKLGEKKSSAQKAWKCRGERNGAERGRRGSGLTRFMNGDDSGRFPTRAEGVSVLGPVTKRKKEELCWLRHVL